MPRSKAATVPEKPTIGIFTSIFVVESGLFPGMERSYVNYEYISAVEAAGAIPLLIPVVKDEATIRRQVDSVDALLMTGGYDPSPLFYGENPSRQIGFIFPEIDEHQLAAIRIAAELKKPMMGICRGLQILNVAFGGTLYQDLTLIPNSYIQHFQKSRKHSPGHQVVVEKGTLLADVFGESVIQTNSFHHLAVKDLAPGFIVSAHAPDGVVEGIERREGAPIMAVQWHPEMMYERQPMMLDLFKKFIAIVNERRG